MFTDIVGYTELMQKNESLAAKARAKHRSVFEAQHLNYNGKLIQYFGDGTLSVFSSAIECVECAIAIQKTLQKNDPLPIRIGIHLGDIVHDKTEVYGDGVNLASRIENLCTPGAIFISKKINDELLNYNQIPTISLGQFSLKNVIKPIEIFAVSNSDIAVPQRSDIKNISSFEDKTIAVLPFANFSTDKENEFFSDGITEEIINALAKIKQLKVTSRTSSFFYKNKNIPIKQIADDLGVSTILEGSVRLSGKTIRITAQLIQAQDDFHYWSETWDRQLENIFEIQDEISLIIAEKLREQFGHFDLEDHLVDKKTNNFKSFELALKGKYHKNLWNPEDALKAIDYFEQALDYDPNYAEVYAAIADCYSFLATTGFMPFQEGWNKTIEYTHKGLTINPESSDVNFQLSNIAFFVECDYTKSLALMKKAIALNPNNAEAQQFLSFLYIIAGDRKQSHHHLEIARSINPLSEETQFFRAYFYYMSDEYEKSLSLLDKCLEKNDKNIPAHSVKTVCLLKLNRYEEVLNYFEEMPAEITIEGEKLGSLALAHAITGDKENTTAYLEKLEKASKEVDGFTADSYRFLMYTVMGDYDKVFEWIENALQNNASLLILRFSDPIANALKADPRYDDYHKRIYGEEKTSVKQKAKKKLLSKEKVNHYTNMLLQHIHNEAPYLDESLSLRSLAEQIDIHPNQLSWLLNESLGKNFNEFINHFRVEHFKKLVKDPKNSNVTILGLAFDSGFNSKSVFNTYFKRETGLTPKAFINQ